MSTRNEDSSPLSGLALRPDLDFFCLLCDFNRIHRLDKITTPYDRSFLLGANYNKMVYI